MTTYVSRFIEWVKNMKTSMKVVIGIWLLFAIGSLERAQAFIHTIYRSPWESWVYAVSLEALIIVGYATLANAAREIYRRNLWKKAWQTTMIAFAAGVTLFLSGAYAQIYLAYLAAREIVKDGSFTSLGMMVQIGNVCLLVIFFAFDIGDFIEIEKDNWIKADNLRRELELERKQAKEREEKREKLIAAEVEAHRIREEKERLASMRWCKYCETHRPSRNFARHVEACAKTRQKLDETR